MAAPDSISVEKLSRLVGTPGCPVLIDVRTDADFGLDPRLLPASQRCSASDATHLSTVAPRSPAVVVCQHGGALSQGVAAWLRHRGSAAEILEGGFEAWARAGQPLVPITTIPPRDAEGRTVWVTRARPKVDRIACPWLIRRFVDPDAAFLFVSPAEVAAVAERFSATPFDIDRAGVSWSHRGELCTFDVMVEEFGLSTPPLLQLARIVRGADTARPDLAAESAGLLAASLGLSRMVSDDQAQLEAGMLLYDAFYRWCRDATEETHNWPTNKPTREPLR